MQARRTVRPPSSCGRRCQLEAAGRAPCGRAARPIPAATAWDTRTRRRKPLGPEPPCGVGDFRAGCGRVCRYVKCGSQERQFDPAPAGNRPLGTCASRNSSRSTRVRIARLPPPTCPPSRMSAETPAIASAAHAPDHADYAPRPPRYACQFGRLASTSSAGAWTPCVASSAVVDALGLGSPSSAEPARQPYCTSPLRTGAARGYIGERLHPSPLRAGAPTARVREALAERNREPPHNLRCIGPSRYVTATPPASPSRSFGRPVRSRGRTGGPRLWPSSKPSTSSCCGAAALGPW